MTFEPTSQNEDLRALERLVVGDPEFEQLEASLADFNIFEAVGVIRQELRHSDFLAFLLDPNQSHGLGDAFATRFLQRAIQGAPRADLPVSPIQLDVWSLDDASVSREWQNIDVLLLSEGHKLAVIVENKIDSHEHSQQLERYYSIIRQQYPDWLILPILLTPEGNPPTSDPRYVPCSYTTVQSVCHEILRGRGSAMGPPVRLLIEHYTQMLERHIMSDSSIAKLCRAIYQKHKRALDLIYEHRPDRVDTLRRFLEILVRETPGLVLEDSSKSYIRFFAKDWDTPALCVGEGWVRSRRIMLYEIENYGDSVRVKLIVGPGRADIKARLVAMAERSDAFNLSGRRGTKWQTLFSRSLLPGKRTGEMELEEIEGRIRREWNQFVVQELPRINAAVVADRWLFEDGGSGPHLEQAAPGA
jgi:hypothetical protein